MTKRSIVHIEIPSANFDTSGRFYNELFGWKITPVPEMNYELWEPEEGLGGGFNPLGDDVRAGEILIYVDSDDIEADLQRAQSLGATVVRSKTEIPTFGWFGIFKDPTGNAIAVYTSMNPRVSD
jgi:predicted enzyme related to lactoylglutathione lyase